MEAKTLCEYGCGQDAKYQLKNGRWCCGEKMNYCNKFKQTVRLKTKESWQKGRKWKNDNKPENSFVDFCEYGCGEKSKYQLKNGKWCCSKSSNSCKVNRDKNSDKVKVAYLSGILNAREKYKNQSEESKRNFNWNKGLTKETNESVKHGAQTLASRYKNGEIKPGFLGKHLSIEARDKVSKARIKYLKKNPHVKWYKVSNGEKLITVQGKWEKKVAEWLTQNKIKWERKKLKYDKTKTYTPDFNVVLEDEFIEVKGWWKERDKYKMFLALRDNPNIKIRILDKRHIDKLDKIKINDLPMFVDEFKFEDIDMSKFKNVWKNDNIGG